MWKILPLLAKHGFAGILAGTVVIFHWYTISVAIPSMIQIFREELAAERDERHRDTERLIGAIERLRTREGNAAIP